MSCVGDNWLVPSADPCNQTSGVTTLNTLSGAIDLTSTDGSITFTPSTTTINLKSSQTQAFGNNTITTAAVTNTAVPLSTVGFTNTASSDIIANGSATFKTTSNVIYDINVYLTIDGVKMNTTEFITSIQGVGHYMTATITGFRLALTGGAHTLRLWAYTNAPNGTITCVAQTTNGLANLL